jgi:phosphoglycerol transferase
VPDAAGYWFANYVTPAIRSWDRLLPTLQILILCLAVVLSAELGWLSRRRTVIGVTAAVLVLTLFDGVLPYHSIVERQLSRGAVTVSAGRAYARAVNTQEPSRCGVLELPFMVFPESPRTGRLRDYSHFVVAMTNRDKLWSYGAVKYTSAGLWQMRLGNNITAASVAALRDAGFCGVHVDTRGFRPDEVAPVLGQIESLLGPAVARGHQDDWRFYLIPGGAAHVNALEDPQRLSASTRNFFFSTDVPANPTSQP